MSAMIDERLLCVHPVISTIITELSKDRAPTSVVRARVEYLIRLLENIHYPEDEKQEADDPPPSKTARRFGEFTRSWREGQSRQKGRTTP